MRRDGFLLPFSLLLAVLLSQAFHSFLFESWWLDETVSLWIVSGSFSEVLSRSVHYQGQSPLYYSLLWAWMRVAGEGEFVTRLPSVLCLLVAVTISIRWLYQSAGPMAAFMGVLILLSIDQVLLALTARPYALALLLAILTLRTFSLLSHSPRYWLRAGLLLALTGYAHYLYAACALVGFILAGTERKRALQAIGVAFLLLTPGLLQLQALVNGRDLFFIDPPGINSLLRALVPLEVAIPLCVALSLGLVLYGGKAGGGVGIATADSSFWRVHREFVWWWALVPVLLWLAALLKFTVFTERYVLWCLWGGAMGMAVLMSRLRPPAVVRLVLIVISVFSIARGFDRVWQIEDWRGAFLKIRSLESCQRPNAQVLLHSGLIELESENDASTATATREYLSAPGEVYGVGLRFLNVSATAMSAEFLDPERSALGTTWSEDVCAMVGLRKRLPPVLRESLEKYSLAEKEAAALKNTKELLQALLERRGLAFESLVSADSSVFAGQIISAR
jgi:hypothetical protein